MVVRAGDVEDGETITTPFGTGHVVGDRDARARTGGTDDRGDIVRRDKALRSGCRGAASTQVESARTASRVVPSSSRPDFRWLRKGRVRAAAAMAGVIDSIGPVKPRRMPTLDAIGLRGRGCYEQRGSRRSEHELFHRFHSTFDVVVVATSSHLVVGSGV